ncbi:MAG: PDZ domain-containing protein, partial [Acidobacteriales bacterium]|nr:PDZ domain-containing protein [Terriglobales bacterium]
MQELASRPRAPWWAYLIALPFVTAFLFESYVGLMGYGPVGFVRQGGTDKVVVGELRPGLPMEKAGAQVGDVLVVADGQPIRNSDDWVHVLQQFDVEKPIPLTIERAGEPIKLTLVLPRRRFWQQLERADLLQVLGGIALGLVYQCLGLLVLFSRPRDWVALLGALILLTLGVGMAAGGVSSRAVLFRQLPLALQGLFFATHFVGGYLFFLFFALFPRPVFQRRWILAALVLPGISVLPLMLIHDYHLFYTPGNVVAMLPGWRENLEQAVNMAFALAGLIVFTVGYTRLRDVNERRRVRLILFSALITFGSFLLFFALAFFAPASAAFHFIGTTPAMGFLLLFLWSMFPLAFAHALLRHRLFDVRIIIRQSLQYAVARGALIALVPTAAGLLLLDLLLHRDQPIGAILAARGWYYAAIGGLAYVAHKNQRRWMQALDQRFFRERYNAQQLLREIVDEVRQATSFEAEAPRVVARVEAALHPEFVALLVRAPREASYRTLASAPAGMAPPAIRADSKLMSLMRVLAKPVQISLRESGWLKQQLPHSETDFLRESRIEMLVPVAVSPERSEALLALGSKRSEEPYSTEDQELLLAVSSALALLMERPARQHVTQGFEECSQCGLVYDSGMMRCVTDGTALTPNNFARTLAGRYQLQQRLGRGGMGTVYRSVDTA